jgi:hypothetical protein
MIEIPDMVFNGQIESYDGNTWFAGLIYYMKYGCN